MLSSRLEDSTVHNSRTAGSYRNCFSNSCLHAGDHILSSTFILFHVKCPNSVSFSIWMPFFTHQQKQTHSLIRKNEKFLHDYLVLNHLVVCQVINCTFKLCIQQLPGTHGLFLVQHSFPKLRSCCANAGKKGKRGEGTGSSRCDHGKATGMSIACPALDFFTVLAWPEFAIKVMKPVSS